LNLERYVRRSLARIRDEGLLGIHETVPPRYLRGVEMLGEAFDPGLVRSVEIYHKNHARAPDLIDPQSFGNKQLLFKFFGLVPEITPSDKLRAHDWLVPDLRAEIRRPRILWRGQTPDLPANDAIEPGTFWLKCNHGSGTNLPVTFPLSGQDRAEIGMLTKRLLRRVHSTWLGPGFAEGHYRRAWPFAA
jgi:hypothetical protein